MKTLLGWTAVIVLALGLGGGALPPTVSAADLPWPFFMVHRTVVPNAPTKIDPNGQDLTKAPDGSSVTVSGSGSFDPDSKQAQGSGKFTIKDAGGNVKAQGSWQVTGFVSWQRVPGGFPPGAKLEVTVPAPAGSIPSSGVLKVNVKLENQGDGVLSVNCMLPTTPMELNIVEGITLTGGNFNFTQIVEGDERTIFYAPASAGPATLPKTGGEAPPLASEALVLAALGVGLLGVGFVLRRRRA